MEEFLLFSHLGPFAAGGRGIHIFPPSPRLHRGFKRFLFQRFTGKRRGKKLKRS